MKALHVPDEVWIMFLTNGVLLVQPRDWTLLTLMNFYLLAQLNVWRLRMRKNNYLIIIDSILMSNLIITRLNSHV